MMETMAGEVSSGGYRAQVSWLALYSPSFGIALGAGRGCTGSLRLDGAKFYSLGTRGLFC